LIRTNSHCFDHGFNPWDTCTLVCNAAAADDDNNNNTNNNNNMALKCTFGNNYKCCEDDGGYDNDAHLVTYPKEVKFSPLSLCLSVNRTTQKLFIIQIFMERLYIIQRPIRLYSE